jgi:diacylglycerol kinase family enzyme
VEPNDKAQNGSSASPIALRSVLATDLPEQFVHDYQPSGSACWQIRSDNSPPLPKVHIIASTGAGTKQAASVWELAVKPLLDHLNIFEHQHYKLHLTKSEHSVTELASDVFLPEANKGVKQAILLMSGDGGVVDIINAILASERSRNYVKPNIALLPLGTGNALAHSAGLTKDNTLGLKSQVRGSPKELPLFRASFSPGARLLVNEGRGEKHLYSVSGIPTAYGAVVISWGLHATLVADSDTTEYRKFGVDRFKMAGKEALFPSDGSPPHPYKGKVSILRTSTNTKDNWETLERDTHGYILATLMSQLEKGFTISPSSRPLDGKLRLVHFGALSGQEAMDIMTMAYQGGKHVDDPRVGYEEIEGLRIQFDEEDARWRRVCIDGKIIRVEKGGWSEVRNGVHGVLDIIAP